jgi:predicted nuclease of predicted toxin-antitoxin system
VRAVVDAQLPIGLARELRLLGHDVVHLAEIGMVAAKDGEIWRFCSDSGRAIVTKDQDFARLRALRDIGPVVVWVRIGNRRTAETIALIRAVWPAVVSAVEAGEGVVEIA